MLNIEYHITLLTSFLQLQYPTEISRNLNSLIRKAGLSKMQNILTSMNLPKPVQKLMTRYFDYGELFKVEGYEL